MPFAWVALDQLVLDRDLRHLPTLLRRALASIPPPQPSWRCEEGD
ncbi:MAG TPA: hypothetical protein VKG82_02820 [Solirubrobacteraceae bacterium]|nr:hypothetical protein [Solirubrobacteraceae bacterium]